MSVLDSVLVDALVSVGPPGELARAELRDRTVLEVPAIFTAETTSVLRGLVLRGELSPVRAATALEQVRTSATVPGDFATHGYFGAYTSTLGSFAPYAADSVRLRARALSPETVCG